MFNIVRKHHAQSNESCNHYCYIANEEKIARKKRFYYCLIRAMRSALKQGSMIWNGICTVTNSIFNASEWKHNHAQLQKKSDALCCCQKIFKQILCTLAGKSFGSASVKGKKSVLHYEAAQINAPKALTEGNMVGGKEFVTVSWFY